MKSKIKPLLLILSLLVIISAGIFLFTACSEDGYTENQPAEEKTIDDFDGKHIGVLIGSILDEYIEERLPNAEISYFSTISDSITALNSGQLDAVAQDSPSNVYICATESSMSYIDETLSKYATSYGAVFPKNESGAKLRDQFNEFLTKIEKDNYLENLINSWLNKDDVDYSLCDYESLSGTNGTLTMATDATQVPFVFFEDGKIVGPDVVLATLFCKEYGYKLELMNMDFGGVIPSLGKKADFSLCSISITEERAKSVYFSNPYYSTNMSLLCMNDNVESDEGFFESLKTSFTRTFVEENRWQVFLEGIGVTLLITVLALILGTILGFLLYLLCYSGRRIFTTITDIFSRVLNSLPVVVVLMIFYYLIFNKSPFSGTTVAVIVFTIIFATTMYSMIKVGVNAIGPDQEEAARAMGFTKLHGFFVIIFPQAAVQFLPRYKEEVISLIKATAIVGYIAVQDLTKVSDIIRSRTYEAFFPLISSAVVYLILAEILILIVKAISVNVDTKARKADTILKGVKVDD